MFGQMKQVAIIGAGVSGLTCGVFLAERGYGTAIFAKEAGPKTTSGTAAAVWFPYDVEPAERVIEWALQTYKVLGDLANNAASGVSLIELRQYSRRGSIPIPDWAIPLGARMLDGPSPFNPAEDTPNRSHSGGCGLGSGFALTVPLMDTTIYLDYLADRFVQAGGEINIGLAVEKLDQIGPDFDLLVNCAGLGARALVNDCVLEPHRGQVAVVPKIDRLRCAIVCDDAPLTYAIPRTNDCLFGGTNELSDNLTVDRDATSRIVAECSRALDIASPPVLAELVGLRPFRKSGVRLERDRLPGGRAVIHNYGHGGSGFTLSWGCASAVFDLATRQRSK